MSDATFDVVVAGLGAMGGAVAYHLARRGARVLGLDRFTPPHTHGSSHGESRLIREAYFEHPSYVPLVQRAYRLWEELEAETGRPLLRRTGALMLGPPDGELVRGATRSAELHGLPFQRLDAGEAVHHFPAFRPEAPTVGVYEPRAGVLYPEECVAAHLQAAEAHGARLHFGEAVERWTDSSDGVEVTTSRGRYRAGGLVLCVGPWLADLMPALALEVERQVMLWLRPRARPEWFLPDQFPVFLWEMEPHRLFYGVADLGSGVKVAQHHGGQMASSIRSLDDTVREPDVDRVRAFLQRHLPQADGLLLRGAVCRYTNTGDSHFLIDRHPESPAAWLVSPCSGHGFKFASVVGELLADQVLEGSTRHDTSLFQIRTRATDTPSAPRHP